jgi:acyl-CoA reductase-like NAD-dependent aldehyde dehydrogenase
VNSAPARGPDHFPFQGFRDSGIGSQGIKNSLEMMVKQARRPLAPLLACGLLPM